MVVPALLDDVTRSSSDGRICHHPFVATVDQLRRNIARRAARRSRQRRRTNTDSTCGRIDRIDADSRQMRKKDTQVRTLERSSPAFSELGVGSILLSVSTSDSFRLGQHAEHDCRWCGCSAVDLGQFVVGTDQADPQSFDFTEPSVSWPTTAWSDRWGVSDASMESFFSLLQNNVLDTRRWATQQELRIAIVTWIERTYHRRRRQRALGKLTPIEYEMIMTPANMLAA